MELVASLPADTQLSRVGEWARRAERLGFDTLHVSETVHDPFVSSTLALEHTSRLNVRTSMVVAFPRSPMVSAYAAWDLARFSGGRFHLGVASQVRGNIVGRYSAPWIDPVAQLRDYIGALRAIFFAFATGEPLYYEGPHYRFDRLQPYFNPGLLEHPAPPIYSGGVNAGMCALGGAVADGFVCHPTSSHPEFLAAQLMPAIEQGTRESGRTDGGPLLVASARPLTGSSEADVAHARSEQRADLAFLYSTPAYARQLELLGLGELAAELSARAQAKDWSGLEDCLSEEVIDRLKPAGTYAELPAVLTAWYGGRCDGLILDLPSTAADDEALGELVANLRTIPTRR